MFPHDSLLACYVEVLKNLHFAICNKAVKVQHVKILSRQGFLRSCIISRFDQTRCLLRRYVEYINSNKDSLHCEALGNFRVFVGDEDQYIHLWRYDDGYSGIDTTMSNLLQDKEYQAIRREIVPLLRSRHSQYLLPFGFWPQQYFRKEPHIYELRSYHLKPGTMVEWGNYWAKAIGMRDYKNNEGYMGLFSQVRSIV